MDVEKECSLLGTLFQSIVTDLKGSSPAWEELVTRGNKLHTLLRTTSMALSAFVESIQKIADVATNTKGSTKDIGSALTRICVRQKMVENKLKQFTNALSENLLMPIQERLEEWKKVANQLEKDHAKEFKKAMHEIKKRNTDTLRLQKKAKKGFKGDLQFQLNSTMHDTNERLRLLEEHERTELRNLLVEERTRICLFGNSLAPVLDLQISMMNEMSHLHELSSDVTRLCRNPKQLPTSTEQLVQDFIRAHSNAAQQPPSPLQDGFQQSNGLGSYASSSPPSSPKSSADSRKSSMCSLNSINSSDSRSSGSLNHNAAPTFHRYQSFHRRNSTNTNTTGQGSPTSCKSAPAGATVARLSSVSSHDSGFVSGMNPVNTFAAPVSSDDRPSSLADRNSTHSSEGMSPVIRSRSSSGQVVEPPAPPATGSRPPSWKDWSRPGPYDTYAPPPSAHQAPFILPNKPSGPLVSQHKPAFTPHRLSAGDLRDAPPPHQPVARQQSEPQFFSPYSSSEPPLKSPPIPPKPSNFVFPIRDEQPLPPPPPLEEECETPVADDSLPPPPPSLLTDPATTPQNDFARPFVPPPDEPPQPMMSHALPARIPYEFGSMTLGRKNSNHSLQYSSSSGYSSQNTTPACSEDTIASHDTDHGSLNGEELHHSAYSNNNDIYSTMPRSRGGANSHGSSRSRRPASTSGMPAPSMISTQISTPGTATIRRKPSSKFNSVRRSAKVPKPVQTPTVPGASVNRLVSTFLPPDDPNAAGQNGHSWHNANYNNSGPGVADLGPEDQVARDLTLKFNQALPPPSLDYLPQEVTHPFHESGVAPLPDQ